RWSEPWGTLQLPAYGVFFIAVACGNSFFGLLRTRGALLLGECSYSIYLLHGTILYLLFVVGAPIINALSTSEIPAALPLTALIIACVASVSFRFIERPAINLGKIVASRLSSPRIVSTNEPKPEAAY